MTEYFEIQYGPYGGPYSTSFVYPSEEVGEDVLLLGLTDDGSSFTGMYQFSHDNNDVMARIIPKDGHSEFIAYETGVLRKGYIGLTDDAQPSEVVMMVLDSSGNVLDSAHNASIVSDAINEFTFTGNVTLQGGTSYRIGVWNKDAWLKVRASANAGWEVRSRDSSNDTFPTPPETWGSDAWLGNMNKSLIYVTT